MCRVFVMIEHPFLVLTRLSKTKKKNDYKVFLLEMFIVTNTNTNQILGVKTRTKFPIF
jgi:hypothetical protein